MTHIFSQDTNPVKAYQHKNLEKTPSKLLIVIRPDRWEAPAILCHH